MRKYLEKLQAYAASSDRGKDAPETILEMLYDVYGEYHNTEDEGVRIAFQQLYEAMHGKTLIEQDEIIYAADVSDTVAGSTDEVLEAGYVIDEDSPEGVFDDVFDGMDDADSDFYED